MSTTAFEMTFSGGTTDQYDQVLEKMGLTGDAPTPTGALFHWCAKTDDGLRIVDVWETAEQFQAFADSQIGPFSAEVGLSPPQVVSYPVYNHMTA